MKQIWGRKVGMTQVFNETGEMVPVTVIDVQPNVVTQVKTVEKDGYSAVQVGFGAQKAQRVSKALTGHMGAAKKGMFKHLREIRVENKEINVGDAISVEGLFEIGSLVDVMGVSVGKGYAGVMKRHHMAGYPMTHGTHEYRRHGGSIGCRKFPGRVFKNKRMSGHMGVDRVTQIGIEVVSVRAQDNLLLVKGSVPGPKNGVVLVRSAIKG